MSKILLVGNGFSSNLISDYKNSIMMKKLYLLIPDLSESINQKFEVFRLKDCNDSKRKIIDIIKEHPLFSTTSASQIYETFFRVYGLENEIYSNNLSSVESMLKVAKLFKIPDINNIKNAANSVYYNEGKNGFSNIDSNVDFNLSKLSAYINSFSYIFTTNYDYLLDDIYNNQVFHLHGGFNYVRTRDSCGAVDVTREINCRKVDNPHLIWGVDGQEKTNLRGGGMTFPMHFPFRFGISCIVEYYEQLRANESNEVHIWGYSGQNDDHINKCIRENKNIHKVFYYCNPKTELYNEEFKNNVKKKFISESTKLFLVSWNSIWENAGFL